MNILVIGCGKVGSKLASKLSEDGHDVSIVDRHESSFELLSDGFSGFTTAGVPIDQDVLRKAGIENCDALAAVSQDDNVNIMVSQLAREIFNVPKVIARIYDPKREDVFSHFGLHTICPTNLTVSSVCSALTEECKTKSMNIGSHTLTFTTVAVPKPLVGSLIDEIAMEKDEVIFAIEHADLSLMLISDESARYRFTYGDKIIVSRLID